MYSTYLRLRVHTHASARDVIRALYGHMRPDARQHGYRSARHAIIREMLDHHAQAQNLHFEITMKTYTKYSDVPAGASYLGSEHGDGSMDENLVDAIDAAHKLACYRDAEGVRHYFDLL